MVNIYCKQPYYSAYLLFCSIVALVCGIYVSVNEHGFWWFLFFLLVSMILFAIAAHRFYVYKKMLQDPHFNQILVQQPAVRISF